MDLNRLVDVLGGMDIPSSRHDIDKPENVRWLLRNLAINNSNHPEFPAVLVALKTLEKLDSWGD